MDEPRERNEEPPTPDLTIVNRADVDRNCYCCSIRRNDTLEQPLFLPDSRAGVNWKQALIAVFRIIGVPDGEVPYRPGVALLVLANAFGRPLGAWQGTLPEPPTRKSHGLKAIGPVPTSRREMRRQVLRFLGADNLLVGFHLPWLLFALKLPVVASRVVELGSQPAFQLLCQKLAADFRVYLTDRFLPQRMPYDRRWPAVLSNFEDRPIELYQGALDNPWAEAVYTGAVWQSVAGHVLPVRRSPSVRLVKDAYVIGNGLAFDDDEKASLGDSVPLLEFDGPDGTT